MITITPVSVLLPSQPTLRDEARPGVLSQGGSRHAGSYIAEGIGRFT